MFKPFDYKISPILKDANSDLCDFFSERFYPKSKWQEAENEAQEIDAKFPKSENADNFISELLPWLENRKRSREKPWQIKKSNGKLEIATANNAILLFLNSLKSTWLDRLLMSGPYDDVHLPTFFPDGGRTFKDFYKFVGEKKVTPGVRWRIILKKKTKKSKTKLKSFVSWLVISPSTDTKKPNCLIIIIDLDRIQQKLSHRAEFVSRFERVVLHELGHARCQIDWYKSQLDKGIRMASSRPEYEFEAWVYSLAIRTYVVSVKSWITRILSDRDHQWMHP